MRCVAARADSLGADVSKAGMAVFHLRICPKNIVSEPIVLPDAESARLEALGTLVDFARDIAASVDVDAPWSVEVLSADGTPVLAKLNKPKTLMRL